MATKVSSGIMVSMATKRGTTRASNGSTPMVCMASTSWFIFIAPISAAKDEAERPARMMAVTSTPNSRSTLMPTSSTEKICAPNCARRFAPRKATVAPTKKLVVATIGTASSPARSISDTVGATRMREGCSISRSSATISRP